MPRSTSVPAILFRENLSEEQLKKMTREQHRLVCSLGKRYNQGGASRAAKRTAAVALGAAAAAAAPSWSRANLPRDMIGAEERKKMPKALRDLEISMVPSHTILSGGDAAKNEYPIRSKRAKNTGTAVTVVKKKTGSKNEKTSDSLWDREEASLKSMREEIAIESEQFGDYFVKYRKQAENLLKKEARLTGKDFDPDTSRKQFWFKEIMLDNRSDAMHRFEITKYLPQAHHCTCAKPAEPAFKVVHRRAENITEERIKKMKEEDWDKLISIQPDLKTNNENNDMVYDIVGRSGAKQAEKLTIAVDARSNEFKCINHSCAPNSLVVITYSSKWGDRVQGVSLFYRRALKAFEEITYDYYNPGQLFRFECRCGSYACRGIKGVVD